MDANEVQAAVPGAWPLLLDYDQAAAFSGIGRRTLERLGACKVLTVYYPVAGYTQSLLEPWLSPLLEPWLSMPLEFLAGEYSLQVIYQAPMQEEEARSFFRHFTHACLMPRGSNWKIQAPMPVICDLSQDSDCCALLEAWAAEPWRDDSPRVLADRMKEIGHGQYAAHVEHFTAAVWQELKKYSDQGERVPGLPLFSVQLLDWRKNLRKLFGEFDRKEQPT